MLISHRHRFIYTKTFKTAGTSVESYFEPACMAPGAWTVSHERDESVSEHGVIGYRGPAQPPGVRWWNHMPAAQLRALAGADVWQTYFKFCVIRNPFDRAVSAFYFARAKGRLPESSEPDMLQFERWLDAGGLRLDREQYTLDGRFALDDVIRYENLHADLQRLCQRLGLAWEPSRLPSFKAGFRPRDAAAEPLYTRRAEQIVRRLCAFEIEHFGYEFAAETAAEPVA